MEDIKLTYGAELEIADWDRSIIIPKSLGVKDINDISVANSDGTCVNPYIEGGKGGEICTVVCNSPTELVYTCQEILNLLPEKSLNHTCWLHIHVGILGVDLTSLDTLKQMLYYVYRNSIQIRDYTSISPVKECDKMPPEYRIKRNLTRTSVMTQYEFQGAMNSRTLDEFWSYFKRKRHMVNMVPLSYQGTIEFRFFYMTFNSLEMLSAIDFCREFILGTLKTNKDVCTILYENSYNFPKSIPFNLEIEEIYRQTLVTPQKKVDNFTLKSWRSC